MTGFKSKRAMSAGAFYAPYIPIQMLAPLPKDNWIDDNTGNILPYGWAGELTYPNVQGFAAHFQMYRDMVEHILATVKNPYNNVLWTKIGDCIYIRFRKQKDMMWFKIRFGV